VARSRKSSSTPTIYSIDLIFFTKYGHLANTWFLKAHWVYEIAYKFSQNCNIAWGFDAEEEELVVKLTIMKISLIPEMWKWLKILHMLHLDIVQI